MQQYLDLVRTVLETGDWQDNRTGIRTLSVPGAMMRYDLQEGFPAVTTKKLAFKAAIGELCGFLRATTNAQGFRDLGCKVWDQNANENATWLANPYRAGQDDLGPIYAAQWRQWPAYKVLPTNTDAGQAQIADAMARGYRAVAAQEEVTDEGKTTSLILYKAIDQLRECLDKIMANPGDRRILFHAWNPAQLEQMALPPCHLLYQFCVNAAKREISLCLYIRSNDLGLGAPFNCASAAALLTLVGRLTGYRPRWCTIFIGDAHIYENHIDMLQEQLTREPFAPPQLVISDRVPDFAKTGVYEPEWLEKVEPSDFELVGYQHHAPLTAPMAV